MPDLRRIQSRSGAPFTVAGQYAPQFQGLLYDLEDAGYAVNPQQSGGYNPRNIAGTNTPSNHAFGRAVDINWTDNARGTKGKIPADLAKTLAAKHGMTWGGLWKNPDPMHFEVANAASPAVSQRSMTNYAGLGGPKEAEPPKGEPMASPFAFDFSNLPAAQYLAKRGQMETGSAPSAPSAAPPPMMQPTSGGKPGLIDSLLNPVTQAGLAILGSPTRDVAQGMQLLDPNRDIDRKYKEALIQKAMKEANDAGATFGKSGNIFQDPQTGQFYSVQFGSNGQKLVEPIGGGLTPSRGVGEVDTGTGTEIIDKATGKPIRNVRKDLYGAEAAKAEGKAEGEATAGMPAIVNTAERALSTIDKIRTHPGKKYGVGVLGVLPGVPGTEQKGFVTLIDQAKGQVFLEAFNSLRGGGAITEAEGRKATEALARLDRAQTPADFDTALDDLEAVVKNGVKAARQKAGLDNPVTDLGSDEWIDAGDGIKIREKRAP
jgi:hypothetical protein